MRMRCYIESEKSTWPFQFKRCSEPKDAGTAVLREDVVLQDQTHLGGIGLLVVDTEAITLDEQGVLVCQLASRHVSVATL